MRHHLLFCLSLVCAPLLAAEPAGSQDLEVLPRLARSVIVDYRDNPAAERRYPQDSLRRISGQLVAREVLVEGRLRALTYQLPEEHGPREALQIARQHLQAQGAPLLFWCEGRDCGSSSLWANQIFGSAKLYGPEEQQSYLLLRLADEAKGLAKARGKGMFIVHGEAPAEVVAVQVAAPAPRPAEALPA